MSLSRYVRKLQLMAQFGDSLSTLSECKRQKQGSVVFPFDCSCAYSIGYNGPARGRANESCLGLAAVGFCGCAHAECNAIAKLDPQRAKASIIYCTTMPCGWCANAILNSGCIKGVLFGNDYRDPQGRDILVDSGQVSIMQLSKLAKKLEQETIDLLKQWINGWEIRRD